MKIQRNSIRINEGRRKVDENKVNELAESIKQIGLINPITVKHDGAIGEYLLVAGMHRLKAYELLGKEEIQANIISGTNLELELIEIDENLIRNDLHYTEIDDLTSRRKEIYEEMYPETKHGGDRKSEEIKSRIPTLEKPSFVTDTSNKTGKSETIIKEEIYRAKNLIPESKNVLKEKNINKTEATKLAREEPETQSKVVELISTGKVKKVEEAKQILDPVDKEYQKISKEIDKNHDNYKLVANLLNAPKYLQIDKEHIENYLSYTDEYFQERFIENCNRMIEKLNEMKAIYSSLNKIRRIK